MERLEWGLNSKVRMRGFNEEDLMKRFEWSVWLGDLNGM